VADKNREILRFALNDKVLYGRKGFGCGCAATKALKKRKITVIQSGTKCSEESKFSRSISLDFKRNVDDWKKQESKGIIQIR